MRRGEAVEEVVSAREEVPYTHIETENQLPQRTLTLIALITLTLADLFFSFFPISSVSIAAGISTPHLHLLVSGEGEGEGEGRRPFFT